MLRLSVREIRGAFWWGRCWRLSKARAGGSRAAPTRVLASVVLRIIFIQGHPNSNNYSLPALGPESGGLLVEGRWRSSKTGGSRSLFHKSSPMIYAKQSKTIFDDFPGKSMEYDLKVRHSCESRNPESPILGEVRLLKQAPRATPTRLLASIA